MNKIKKHLLISANVEQLAINLMNIINIGTTLISEKFMIIFAKFWTEK